MLKIRWEKLKLYCQLHSLVDENGEPDYNALADQAKIARITLYKIKKYDIGFGPMIVNNLIDLTGLPFHELFLWHRPSESVSGRKGGQVA